MMLFKNIKEPVRSTLTVSRPIPYYPNGPDGSPQYLRSPSHYFEASPGLSSAFEHKTIEHTPFKRSFAEAEMEEGYKKKPSEAEKPTEEYLVGAKLGLVVAVLCMVAFLVMLGGGIVATAIPSITSEFNSVSDVGWYGIAYLLANCAVQPLSGKIYMSFDTKWSFLAFLTVFELGSALCGGAQSSPMLIAGRAVAGIGGAGLTNGGLVIITRVAPPKKRPSFISIMMSMVALGQLVAPLIGGPLTQNASWRWCFLLNLPIGLAVAVVIVFVQISTAVPKPMQKLTIIKRIERNLDLVGFALFSTACVALIMPLQWAGSTYPWVSAEVILPLIASFMAFAVFIAWQYTKGDAALIRFSLLLKKEVLCSCLVTLFTRGAMFVHVYYLPLYFQLVKQTSPIMSGVDNLPSFISQILISIVAGRFVSKHGFYTPVSIVGSAINAVGAGLMTTFTPSTNTGTWIGYEIVTGFGRGMVMQMPLSAVTSVLSQKDVTTGLSLITFSQFFGGTLFIACAQSVFINELPQTLHQYAPSLGNTSGGTGSINTAAIPPAILPGVLLAYNQAIVYTFYIAMTGAACAFLASFGMGFHKPKPPPKSTPKPAPKSDEKPAVPGAEEKPRPPPLRDMEGTMKRNNAWKRQTLVMEGL